MRLPARVVLEDLVRSLGVRNVDVIDPIVDPGGFKELLAARLAAPELAVIISRRNCLLAAGKIKAYERAITSNGAVEDCQ